ncbi:hypothetical protein JCM8202v2_003454 [Rhodotorula sphaerocarpa]
MARSFAASLALAAAAVFVCSSSLPVASAFHVHGHGGSTGGDVVPGSYIVQVDTSASTLSKRGMTPFTALEHTLASVSGQGVRYALRQRFEAAGEAFTGFSLKVDGDVPMDKLALIPGVHRVWPVRKYRLPREVTVEDYQPVDSASSSKSRRSSLDVTEPTLEKRGTTYPPASAYKNDTFYPHVDTGIDILHDRGILGEGVKVGIIDTGVDYKNPILGGCFGPGCHISFGYDFAGDSYNGNNEPHADPDPYTNCTEHGTHVTGIVGALANQYGFSGAAPAATLGHYRVFGCTGETANDLILAALERAYSVDHVDIVSLSLGGAVGWLDDTAVQIYQNFLATVGVQVVAAAGNDRSEGPFFSESPAAGLLTNAVASVDPHNLPAYRAYLLGAPPVPYQAPTPLNVSDTRILYFTSTDPTVQDDACSALPASTPDLSNKVVVVKRGTCDFTTKLANVAKAGGQVVLIYNAQGRIVIPQLNVGNSGLKAVGSLRYIDGMRLLDLYKSRPRGQAISFTPPTELIPGVTDYVSGGLVSTYSSFGPTNGLYLFPSIAAPGASIISTVPGGVGILRGTTGAYALLLSARKSDKLSPPAARALMMSTCSQAPSTYNGTLADTVTLQGAGVVNVNRAIESRTMISPPQITLNDTAYFDPAHTITIENRESGSVTYSLSMDTARTIATYNNGVSQVLVSTDPATLRIGPPGVTFSQQKFTLPAGGKIEVNLVFTPPRISGFQRRQFPIYSGYVRVDAQLTGSSSRAYTIPYVGLAAKMIDMPILDSTSQALGVAVPFIAVGQNIQSGPTNFSLSDPQGPPICYYRLAGGTRKVTLDLVDGEYNWETTIPSVQNPSQRMAKRSISARDTDKAEPLPGSYYLVPTIGTIQSPDYWPPRDYLVDGPYPYSDFEVVINGTYTDRNGDVHQAPLGKKYKVLLRGLHITANPGYSESYDSWLSPVFQLNP